MSHYNIDERDILFNLKELPGLSGYDGIEGFADTSQETLDMIYDAAKKYALEVAAPLFKVGDRQGCSLQDGKVTLADGVKEAWDQYRELDMIGMNSDSEYGGAELPHFFSTPVAELECGSFVSFSMLPMLTRGAARLLLTFGSDELKSKYVENMFSGTWSGTMCLTEPGAGSDVGAGVTKAVPEGDHYKITGTKIFITWGEHDLTENIIHLVLARIEGAPAGSKGLSLFVVPKYRLDENGRPGTFNDVQCAGIEHKMGINASPTCVLNFGSENACRGYLIGEAQQGMRYMFLMMNEARLEVGIQGMAQAGAAYLSARNYAAERVQGVRMTAEGPKPAKIIEHPDVQRMLLRMRTLVHGSRAMIYHMSQYLDFGHHHPTDQDKYQTMAELMTPICKSYCSDMGFRVAEMAVQTYGGFGYCNEYPVEQYLRDLKISSIYEGTNGIQALDLVFRKILATEGKGLKLWMQDATAVCQSVAGIERLAPLAGAMGKAMQTLGETAMVFGKWYGEKKMDHIQFRATEFQENMGHVMLAYFLLVQAKYAAEKLESGVSDNDRKFYEQKLVTTEYAFSDLLPGAVFALKAMTQENIPGLAAEF